MLENTVRKDDYVALVQHMKDSRSAKQTLHCVSAFLTKRKPRSNTKDVVCIVEIESMDTALEDVCLNAIDEEEWIEWTAWWASH